MQTSFEVSGMVIAFAVKVVAGGFSGFSEVPVMKTVLARIFPRMFGRIGINKVEVPDQHPGSKGGHETIVQPGDGHIMKHLGMVNGFPVARCHHDGGEAHPAWLRSMASDRRRQGRGSWF